VRRVEKGNDVDSRTNGRELAVREPTDVAEATGGIDHAPRELGILLIVAGIGGVLLPGPVGTPFLIAGGLILWPTAFRGVGKCLQKRFPRFHREGVHQMTRFIGDLERRYPWPE
jgi:hypothetical protein